MSREGTKKGGRPGGSALDVPGNRLLPLCGRVRPCEAAGAVRLPGEASRRGFPARAELTRALEWAELTRASERAELVQGSGSGRRQGAVLARGARRSLAQDARLVCGEGEGKGSFFGLVPPPRAGRYPQKVVIEIVNIFRWFRVSNKIMWKFLHFLSSLCAMLGALR